VPGLGVERPRDGADRARWYVGLGLASGE
jgi:hypothetical protein